VTKTFRFKNSSRIDWLAVDDAIVEYRARKAGATAIARDTGISRSSINKRIAMLIVGKRIAPLVVKGRETSEEERAVIAREYADCDTHELSARLGMTMEQLSRAAKTVGIRRSHEAIVRQEQAAAVGWRESAGAAKLMMVRSARRRAAAEASVANADERDLSRVPPGFSLDRVTCTGRIYTGAGPDGSSRTLHLIK
jgi:hypothetical protein